MRGVPLTERRRGQAYAVLAALAWSSAGVLQRQLSVRVAGQIAGRGAFAFIALGVYLLVSRRTIRPRVPRRRILVMAVAMATAQGCFILALNHSSVAHVLFFQALSPLGAALLGARMLNERSDGTTMAAMVAAVAGVALMVGGPGAGTALGNGLAFITAVAFAVVIVIGRQQRSSSTVSAICLAQLILVATFGPLTDLAHLHLGDIGWLAALGVAQTAAGTLFFAAAARSLPAAELALILLLEVILGPLWTWIILFETPSTATLIGGAIVVAAVALQVGAQRGAPRKVAVLPLAGDHELAGERSRNASPG